MVYYKTKYFKEKGLYMAFILAALGGVVLGGGLAGWILSNRWKQQVEQVKEALTELANKHKEEQQKNKEFKQELADTKYKLGEAKKDLAAR
jgi:cell division protein FtsL